MRRVLFFALACLSLGVCFAIDPPTPSPKAPQEFTNDELDARIKDLTEKAKVYRRNANVADRRSNGLMNRDMSAYRQSLAARDRFKVYAEQVEAELQKLKAEKAKRANTQPQEKKQPQQQPNKPA
jgi:hypothetical protein